MVDADEVLTQEPDWEKAAWSVTEDSGLAQSWAQMIRLGKNENEE